MLYVFVLLRTTEFGVSFILSFAEHFDVRLGATCGTRSHVFARNGRISVCRQCITLESLFVWKIAIDRRKSKFYNSFDPWKFIK